MSLPGSSTMAAVDQEDGGQRRALGGGAIRRGAGAAPAEAKILTKKAFENAIAVVMAIGGSTNAVLQPASRSRARRAWRWALEDFRRCAPRARALRPQAVRALRGHRSPSRRRIPQVMRILYANGVLHGDALTIDGRTVAAVIKDGLGAPIGRSGCDRPWDKPLAPQGLIVILRRQPRARRRRRQNQWTRARRRSQVLRACSTRKKRVWQPFSREYQGGRLHRIAMRGEGRPGDARDARANGGPWSGAGSSARRLA